MNNNSEDEDRTSRRKRGDDMSIKAFGVEVQASGRSVTLVLIALAIIGEVFWHDYKSDNWNKIMHEGLWVQTLIIATPEADRQTVLKKSIESSTVPEAVKIKIGAQ